MGGFTGGLAAYRRAALIPAFERFRRAGLIVPAARAVPHISRPRRVLAAERHTTQADWPGQQPLALPEASYGIANATLRQASTLAITAAGKLPMVRWMRL